MTVAVKDLCAWLSAEVRTRQDRLKQLEEKGKLMIVLLGHSMGGIVCELEINNNAAQLHGAKIVGLLAYDTPFYSVNSKLVSKTALDHVDEVSRQVNRFWPGQSTTTARTVQKQISSSKQSSFGGWGLLAGVVGTVAVGAAAYVARDHIVSGLSVAKDHLQFVSILADFETCERRVQELIKVQELMFRCFYIELPYDKELPNSAFTFIALPPEDTAHLFIPIKFSAESEIKAHTGMFNPMKNHNYYTLGSDSVLLILEMVARSRRKQETAATMADVLDLD
ncbi:hypothetical protein EC973_008101 [Apophysomyces ossiformis]|uniref:GPI inositol-deacylase n=1 Tax=Apophysomyces ossiformis TaxID=679940 RepID=A0A8H7EQ18_9FUNG|nr:hypothetical protein EC973_008101 [Apophysomyces ossiformis]